jgi:hypothetical protein
VLADLLREAANDLMSPKLVESHPA